MLSSDVIAGDEAYEFTWVGEKAAIVEANKSLSTRFCAPSRRNLSTGTARKICTLRATILRC